MISGSILAKGNTDLCYIDATLDKKIKIKILEEFLLSFVYCSYRAGRWNFVRMQDIAAVHPARDCKRFFFRLKMSVLPMLELLPDLNPIKNIRGLLAQALYCNKRQF